MNKDDEGATISSKYSPSDLQPFILKCLHSNFVPYANANCDSLQIRREYPTYSTI